MINSKNSKQFVKDFLSLHKELITAPFEESLSLAMQSQINEKRIASFLTFNVITN